MGLASAGAAAPDRAQPHAHQAAKPNIRFAYGVGGSPHRDSNLCAAYDTPDGYSSDPFGFNDLGRATTDGDSLGHAFAYPDVHNTRHGYANPCYFG